MSAITQSAAATDSYFAADGPFYLGEPTTFEPLDDDCPTEYAAVEYVAAATLGQPIAVGYLYFETPEGPHAVRCYEIGTAIMRGRGIWLLVPVFDTWDSAVAEADQSRDVLRGAFGPRSDGFIATAYIPVLGTLPPKPHPSLDPSSVYDASLFDDVTANLRPRTGVDAHDLDRVIAELLEVGYWIDAKRDGVESLQGALPRWITDRLSPGSPIRIAGT